MESSRFSKQAASDWLVKQDNLHKADAIGVLSGGFPARAFEAAELYHQGYAG